MKKKLFFSIAALACGLMAISTLNLPQTKTAKAAPKEGWQCVNGDREYEDIEGGVKLNDLAWSVQFQKDDEMYLDGASFTFTTDINASQTCQGFFFGAEPATTFGYTGPVFLIGHNCWTNQLRLLCTTNHDLTSTTSYWYTGTDQTTPGCGGQVSPQIVGNSATADTVDSLNYKFTRFNASWWKVEITERVGSTIWGDTANYSVDGSTGLATVTLYIKHADMAVEDNGLCYLEVIGLAGNAKITEFVNGTEWVAPEGPDKDGGVLALNSALNALNSFEYTSSNFAKIKGAYNDAVSSINECKTQADVDKIVQLFKDFIAAIDKISYVEDTSNTFVCSFGACDERKVMAAGTRLKMVTDAWPVTYTSTKKYALDGLSLDFASYNTQAASQVGFWFTQSVAPTTGGGYDFEDGAVINLRQSRWSGQSRLGIVSSHDEASAVKCYQTMSTDNPGFGGPVAELVMTDGNPTYLNYKFEHVKKAWWTLSITSSAYTTLTHQTTNWVVNEDGTITATVYLKSSDLPVDENGEAYLNIYGLNGNVVVDNIVNGQYKELPEEPATSEEIETYKGKIDARAAGYARDEFAKYAIEQASAAKNQIDNLTYASDMEKVCEDFDLSLTAAYNKFLGYDQEIEALDSTANFTPCWGCANKSLRVNDEGGLIAVLPSGYGYRGEFIRQYDPLNFEMNVNLSGLSVNDAFAINFDTASGSYFSEASKYYHMEFLVRNNNKVHTIVSEGTAHNISNEAWGTDNDNTYLGKTLDLGNGGDVHIVVSTSGTKTTVTMNEYSVEFDTTVLNKGNAAPETAQGAYVTLTVFNGSGDRKVLIDKFEDAASKEYADGLAETSKAAYTKVDEAVTAVTSAYGDYVRAGDAEYAAAQKAYADALEVIGATGLASYDLNYYCGELIGELDNAIKGIVEDYSNKIAEAILDCNSIFDNYPLDDYREDEQTAIGTIKGEVALALADEECDTLDEIAKIKEDAVAKLEALKTDAEYKAEEALAAAKDEACKALDAKLEEAGEDDVTEVAKLIGEGKKAINACETIDDVNAKKDEYIKKIDDVIHAKDVVSVDVTGAKAEFTVGDTFSTDGLKVVVTYHDGTTEDITSKVTVDSSKVDMSKEGTYTVTVTYGGVSATYTVTVKAAATPDPDPTPEKKSGCGSSILAASGIMTLVAATGICLLSLKKRKED